MRHLFLPGPLSLLPLTCQGSGRCEKTAGYGDLKVRARRRSGAWRDGGEVRSAEDRALLGDHELEVIFAAARAPRKLGEPMAFEIYYAALTGEKKSEHGLPENQMKLLKDPKSLAKIGFGQWIGFIPYAGVGLSGLKILTNDDRTPVRAASAQQLAYDPDPRARPSAQRIGVPAKPPRPDLSELVNGKRGISPKCRSGSPGIRRHGGKLAFAAGGSMTSPMFGTTGSITISPRPPKTRWPCWRRSRAPEKAPQPSGEQALCRAGGLRSEGLARSSRAS